MQAQAPLLISALGMWTCAGDQAAANGGDLTVRRPSNDALAELQQLARNHAQQQQQQQERQRQVSLPAFGKFPAHWRLPMQGCVSLRLRAALLRSQRACFGIVSVQNHLNAG